MQAARKKLSDMCDFFKNSVAWCGLLFLMFVVLPALNVIIGGVYLGQCRRKPGIPVCFVVVGSIELVLLFCMLLMRKYGNDNAVCIRKIILNCWSFSFGARLGGSSWVYGIYNSFDAHDSSSPKYCHPVLVSSAFWIANSTYALLTTIAIVWGYYQVTKCLKKREK